MAKGADTPLMRQYLEMKRRHPDAILFFRVGDFYEMFYEDAEEASRLLDLTLTSRNNGSAGDVPLAGVPVRAAQEYVRRLIRLGRRVAVCEQVEDASEAEGLVRREVVETVTPGAVFSEDLLSSRRNNFLASVAGAPDADRLGLAWVDVSTGEFACEVLRADQLASELDRIDARELLLSRSWEEHGRGLDGDGRVHTVRDDWWFDGDLAAEGLCRHFKVRNLASFGLEGAADGPAVAAAGALLSYLREVQPAGIGHLCAPRVERDSDVLHLDAMTRRNLEVIEPLRPDVGGKSLLAVLDETRTPMGARLLRGWLLRPLADTEAIGERHEAVAELVEDRSRRSRAREVLKEIRDLERLAGKVKTRRAGPRDLLALGRSLSRSPGLREALEPARSSLLRETAEGVEAPGAVVELIERAIDPETPPLLADGGVIRTGFSAELDDLRSLRDGAVDWIAALQGRERSRTGIGSLKVGHNKVFGYYLEVTRPNLEKIPEDYERRQTLANSERFVTPELKEWESKVVTAEERIGQLEQRLFKEVREAVAAEVDRVQDVARRVAIVDVLAGLAEVAERHRYVRPSVDGEYRIEIVAGRHPVVETMMPSERFVPNDVRLDRAERFIILTGPNMAGKSTILRQVGLIVLMAQMGSFVPADAARLGIVDRVFTRVGASDNLAQGQSTFMVEMTETAAILNGATERSLILLDEIGRGTSTYDGVSIAWAVTEYIYERLEAKAIFATHYHELTQIADLLPAVVGYNVAVKEAGQEIVFLRRLERGGADRSYGVHVARLAGLPAEVVERAWEILRDLEQGRDGAGPMLGRRGHLPASANRSQLSLFEGGPDPIVERLRALTPEEITPLDAHAILVQLKRAVEDR